MKLFSLEFSLIYRHKAEICGTAGERRRGAARFPASDGAYAR